MRGARRGAACLRDGLGPDVRRALRGRDPLLPAVREPHVEAVVAADRGVDGGRHRCGALAELLGELRTLRVEIARVLWPRVVVEQQDGGLAERDARHGRRPERGDGVNLLDAHRGALAARVLAPRGLLGARRRRRLLLPARRELRAARLLLRRVEVDFGEELCQLGRDARALHRELGRVLVKLGEEPRDAGDALPRRALAGRFGHGLRCARVKGGCAAH